MTLKVASLLTQKQVRPACLIECLPSMQEKKKTYNHKFGPNYHLKSDVRAGVCNLLRQETDRRVRRPTSSLATECQLQSQSELQETLSQKTFLTGGKGTMNVHFYLKKLCFPSVL